MSESPVWGLILVGKKMSRVVDFHCVRVSDELLLPHMKRVDGMITDNRKRLLHKLHIGQVLKVGVSSKMCNNR